MRPDLFVLAIYTVLACGGMFGVISWSMVRAPSEEEFDLRWIPLFMSSFCPLCLVHFTVFNLQRTDIWLEDAGVMASIWKLRSPLSRHEFAVRKLEAQDWTGWWGFNAMKVVIHGDEQIHKIFGTGSEHERKHVTELCDNLSEIFVQGPAALLEDIKKVRSHRFMVP